jgi:ankyrin repeat protein
MLAALVAIPIVWIRQEVRQEQLNHALIAAVDRNDTATVHRLLRQGADPNAQVLPDDTRPVWKRFRDLLQNRSLPQPIVRQSALTKAVEWGFFPGHIENVDTVKALIDAGANVNFRGGTLATLYSGNIAIMPDDYEWHSTPLIASGALGKYGCLKILLEHHADVNATDSIDTTILMVAAAEGQVDLVDLLLKRGARPDARDSGRRTALTWAIGPSGNHFWGFRKRRKSIADVRKIVSLLLRYNVDVNTRDFTHSTAMSLAHDCWGDRSLIQMLKQAGAKE